MAATSNKAANILYTFCMHTIVSLHLLLRLHQRSQITAVFRNVMLDRGLKAPRVVRTGDCRPRQAIFIVAEAQQLDNSKHSHHHRQHAAQKALVTWPVQPQHPASF